MTEGAVGVAPRMDKDNDGILDGFSQKAPPNLVEISFTNMPSSMVSEDKCTEVAMYKDMMIEHRTVS